MRSKKQFFPVCISTIIYYIPSLSVEILTFLSHQQLFRYLGVFSTYGEYGPLSTFKRISKLVFVIKTKKVVIKNKKHFALCPFKPAQYSYFIRTLYSLQKDIYKNILTVIYSQLYDVKIHMHICMLYI